MPLFEWMPARISCRDGLTGIWVHNEVQLAIQNGCKFFRFSKFTNIHWRSTIRARVRVVYLRTTYTRSLTFRLRLVGSKPWIRIHWEIYLREGVRVDRDGIRPNNAKRGLAKQCLNSYCDKRIERQYRSQTKLISDPHEMHRFLAYSGIKVLKLLFGRDTVVWVSGNILLQNNSRACVILTRSSVLS